MLSESPEPVSVDICSSFERQRTALAHRNARISPVFEGTNPPGGGGFLGSCGRTPYASDGYLVPNPDQSWNATAS